MGGINIPPKKGEIMIKKLKVGNMSVDIDSNISTRVVEIESSIVSVAKTTEVTVAIGITMQEGTEIFNVIAYCNLNRLHRDMMLSAATTLTNDKTGAIIIINPAQETIFAAYLHENEPCAGSLCYNCSAAIKELQDDIVFLHDYTGFILNK